ncbi:hypothetical protein ACFE04_019987 [Oxalis oulophora]
MFQYKTRLQNNLKNFVFHQPRILAPNLLHSNAESDNKLTESQKQNPDDQLAVKLQSLLKNHINRPIEVIEHTLNKCEITPTDDLVLNVLKRHRSDWRPAYVFFKWVAKNSKYSPGSVVYNEIIHVLGRMHRFDDLQQVFDEMSKRGGLVDEETYDALLNRYAAAHRVDEAISLFYKRKEFGLELDLSAFQRLLMWLCRYKHVEDAETLFHSKKHELGFDYDIKTWNIILNGWCVLGNVHEAKRFWKDIVESNCKPDMFTYGTFINALTKKGKLGTALKLFRAMWNKGCEPDVVICNCIIDALCFKKRIPEALEIFREMNERGCKPNAATYNSLIKMKKNRCKMSSDSCNLILKLYLEWDCEADVKFTWDDMEKNGLGPDRRSFTIMIHGLYDKGRINDALRYFTEMISKGLIPEPRTTLLVDSMNSALQEEKKKKKA